MEVGQKSIAIIQVGNDLDHGSDSESDHQYRFIFRLYFVDGMIKFTVDQMWDVSKREESKMALRCFVRGTGSMDLPFTERRWAWEDEAW